MGNAPKSSVLSLAILRRVHDKLGQDDVDTDTALRPKESRRWRWWWNARGWKGTLYLGSLASLMVLLLNLAIILWARARDSAYGQSVLYSGSCDRVKQISIGIHLLINVLSTLLLAASNFAMVSYLVLLRYYVIDALTSSPT
jgi:hypothetical protein